MPCHRLLWALILLALPGVAVAASGAGATEPKLDLSLDPGHLHVQDIRPVPPAAPRDAAAPDAATPDSDSASAEKPLTFGLDVRTRHRVGDEVRADAAAPPSLGDDVKSAIDRSTFGVTGTYRF